MAFHRWMFGLFAIGCSLVSLGGKAAASDLFCQNRIVSEGSSMYDVQTLCGAPDAIQQHLESRTVRRAVSVPCRAGRCVSYVDDTVQVTVVEWTYDFGPQRFLTYLSFVDGSVFDIRTGSYGHKLQ